MENKRVFTLTLSFETLVTTEFQGFCNTFSQRPPSESIRAAIRSSLNAAIAGVHLRFFGTIAVYVALLAYTRDTPSAVGSGPLTEWVNPSIHLFQTIFPS